MFDEAMKDAKEGDMFDQAMERAKDAPIIDIDTDDKRPEDLPAGADMFDVAMQEAANPTMELADEDIEEVDMFDEAMAEAAKPEIELQDEDLEEVEGDMFDLAGAQVVDQKSRIKLEKPIVAEQKPQGDMFDKAMKGDMFDQAMERARKSITDASDEATEIPEAPPLITKETEEPVMEISDEDIISEEELPDGQEHRKAE